MVSFDVRNQTEYGTLRSYIRAGWSVSTPAVTNAGTGGANAYWDRAFIQFAGFTVGRAQSFFDLFTYGGQWTYLNSRTQNDTGASGATVWAYTVNFGNGFTMTGSLEDPVHRRGPVLDNTLAGFFAVGAAPVGDNAFGGQAATLNGFRVPDVVLNARIDQAWGYVGASVAVHDASGAYYQTGNNVNNGHPAEKYGWAASVGGQLNLPGGDGVGINIVYAEGAPGYATNNTVWQLYNGSNSRGLGWLADGVFTTGGDVQLTRAWSINAGYQHIWGARGTWAGRWKTSLYGGYAKIDYNDEATFQINRGFAAGNFCRWWSRDHHALTPLAGNSCNPDTDYWVVGSRTQFNPHPLLDIGLDVYYTKFNTAYSGLTNFAANGARPACVNNAINTCTQDDQGVWSALMRWQRNFYP